jgi:D-alanyl-D-alanine carboxypeptidase
MLNLIFLFIDPGYISAISAILIDAQSGKILYEKNAHELRSPASVVKIATCAYALQQKGDMLDTLLSTPQECIGAVSESEKVKRNYSQPAHWLVHDASHMGLKKGEELTFKDLLYGMMVASADDASNVIAHFAGEGNINTFMDGMNQWIKSCGCSNTTFMNPHGLYHPKQRTTAYDMAFIAKEAMKNSFFRELIKTVKYTRPKTNKQESTQLVQTNQLLRKGKWYYTHATGMKTGKIEHSGYGLVASAEKDNRSLISVVLGCKERADTFKESIQLFEAAFNEPKVEKTLFEQGPQKFEQEFLGVGLVKTYLSTPLTVSYYASTEPTLTASLTWNDFAPPLLKGEPIAMITIHDQDQQLVATAPLLVHSIKEKNFFFKWMDQTGSLTWQLLGGGLILLILILFAYRFSH